MKVNPWEIEAEKKKEFIECAGNIMPESIVNWLFRIEIGRASCRERV